MNRQPAQVAPVTRKRVKYGERLGAQHGVSLAAIGLEAEFAVVVDGRPVRPEQLFGSPRQIIRGPLLHRTGRSYHLPTGGAIYFDTGVIELATPTIELGRGAAARAGRSLWESIRFLRTELDDWERRSGRDVQLAGFSAHYNISFDIPDAARHPGRTPEQLALLLAHIVPWPLMLAGANRRSTGIGVRPRANRIEITADFTPEASLMIASAALVAGIVRQVMRWPSYGLEQLERHGVPRVTPFSLERHSSRRGWVARHSSFERNPFQCDVDEPLWQVDGEGRRSLRWMASRIAGLFAASIARYGDPRTDRLLAGLMDGTVPSLLQLDDRPRAYEQVGRLCDWPDLFPVRALPRSRYERVLIRAISGQPLHLAGDRYRPVGMRGWTHVVFVRERDRTRHALSLDALLRHLRQWELRGGTAQRLRATLRRRLSRPR
jgi:hypothetical protein